MVWVLTINKHLVACECWYCCRKCNRYTCTVGVAAVCCRGSSNHPLVACKDLYCRGNCDRYIRMHSTSTAVQLCVCVCLKHGLSLPVPGVVVRSHAASSPHWAVPFRDHAALCSRICGNVPFATRRLVSLPSWQGLQVSEP